MCIGQVCVCVCVCKCVGWCVCVCMVYAVFICIDFILRGETGVLYNCQSATYWAHTHTPTHTHTHTIQHTDTHTLTHTQAQAHTWTENIGSLARDDPWTSYQLGRGGGEGRRGWGADGPARVALLETSRRR